MSTQTCYNAQMSVGNIIRGLNTRLLVLVNYSATYRLKYRNMKLSMLYARAAIENMDAYIKIQGNMRKSKEKKCTLFKLSSLSFELCDTAQSYPKY